MGRWEDKYNKLMPNIDRMISEQTSKANEARRKQAELGTNVDSTEYKEAKAELKEALAEKARLEQIKPNLDKVRNIIEFRKQVEERVGEYYKVKDIYDKMDSNKKSLEEQQEKYKKATEEVKKLTEKLQSGEIQPEEKSKINAEISKMANQKEESLSTMLNLKQENNSFDEQLKGLKYGELNKEEIDEQIQKLGATVVKCDLACSNLMKGKSVEDIQYDPTKHKYTRPKAKKEKNNEPRNQEENEFGSKGDEEYDSGKDSDYKEENEFESKGDEEYDSEKNLDYEEGETVEENALPTVEKQSWFAKVGKFFKNIKNKVFKREPVVEEERPELDEIIGMNLDRGKRGQLIELDRFTDKEMDEMADAILKDNSKLSTMAEKGATNLRDSIKVEKVDAAKAQLEANKKAAAARDRANHGDRYNEGK